MDVLTFGIFEGLGGELGTGTWELGAGNWSWEEEWEAKKLKHPRISLVILMETLLRAPVFVAPQKVKTSKISMEILIKMLLDVLTFCHKKKLKHLKFLLKS